MGSIPSTAKLNKTMMKKESTIIIAPKIRNIIQTKILWLALK
jgi:hypothetical protein